MLIFFPPNGHYRCDLLDGAEDRTGITTITFKCVLECSIVVNVPNFDGFVKRAWHKLCPIGIEIYRIDPINVLFERLIFRLSILYAPYLIFLSCNPDASLIPSGLKPTKLTPLIYPVRVLSRAFKNVQPEFECFSLWLNILQHAAC